MLDVRHVGLLGTLLVAGVSTPLRAQAPDPAPGDTGGPRPELKAPLSPRRAFTYSLLVPGYSQSILGRDRAGALLVAFEAIALIMIRESALDVREARRNVADSLPIRFVDAGGNVATRYQRTPFSAALLQARRERVEDWVAVLVANHLFAAADGYVASLLWDLPHEVSITPSLFMRGFSIRFSW